MTTRSKKSQGDPKPPKKAVAKKQAKAFTEMDIDTQVQLINEALEPEVYPALAMDGGGMEIMDIQGTDIYIQYYGACGGCSIAETATMPFIEWTLQNQIDPKIKVVRVN